MRKIIGTAWATAVAALLTGCASIVSDDDTKTHIATNPEVAQCELTGKNFQLVVNSPGTVILPARAAPITVACETDGYKTTTAQLDTSVDGWIFGNIILGGVIGAVIDGARGAGMKYPEEIIIALEPASFESEASRDEFYDSRRAEVERKWDEISQKLETQCRSKYEVDASTCEVRRKRVQDDREKEISAIEESRAEAEISPAQTTVQTDRETDS